MSRYSNVIANIHEAAALDLGYDQSQRWSFYDKAKKQYINHKEADCSALTASIYHKAGYPIDLSDPCYTGNAIERYTKAGLIYRNTVGYSLEHIEAAILPGDALLGDGHIMIKADNGQYLSANCDEHGNILGGSAGDQTGNEVNYRPLWNRHGGWLAILAIPQSDKGNTVTASAAKPVTHTTSAPAATALKVGSTGQKVKDWQNYLKTNFPAYAGKLVVDGNFGPATEAATKEFQSRSGITADGVVGPGTDAKASGFSL